MKRLRVYFMLFSLIALSGCGGIPKEIAAKYIDQRSDVYYEGGIEEKPSRGMKDLVIKAQIKTHVEGFYLLESKDSLHGKPTYPFLLNIDGQHIVWQMEGHKESASYFDANGKWTIDGGPGMRYTLEKKIRIAPGPHKVFIALPGDNYFKEFDITLSNDSSSILELSPIYLQNKRRESYLRGIKDFKVAISSIPETKITRDQAILRRRAKQRGFIYSYNQVEFCEAVDNDERKGPSLARLHLVSFPPAVFLFFTLFPITLPVSCRTRRYAC